MKATLSYKQGNFFLKTLDRVPLSMSTDWEQVSPSIFKTTKIKAAAKFKRHCNENAEKIFNRVFNRAFDLPTLPPLLFLDAHQRAGVRWVLSRSRSYLAHAPGAGKTAEAIVAGMLAKGSGQILFIVPPPLALNWEREIIKFTEPFDTWPSIGVVPTSDKKDRTAWGAEFIICPDSMLTKEWVRTRLAKKKFKLIAIDEASRFKEHETERAKVFYGGLHKGVMHPSLFRRARHTVFLDGSPMPNRPMELWAPLYALTPETINFMTPHEFGVRYCGARTNERGEWEYKGASNEFELKTKMQKNFMHVVAESDLEHPERRRSMLFINGLKPSPELKTWERRHLGKLILTDFNENINQGQIATFRHEIGLSKVAWAASYVGERLKDKNESILLFAWHREVCEGLAAALKRFNPGLVMGGTKSEVREKYFKEFQAGTRKIIVGNIGAMGRGHNLQRADRVIFAEYSWTDELNKQCEKRASRRGRDKAAFVRCEYLVAASSMDEKVLNAIFTKEKRVKRLIG